MFAGDHKQLEPTIKSEEASRKGLSMTLFEQVITKYPNVSKMLKIQYRMNEDIMKWSSESMYNNELIAAPEVAHHLLSDSDQYRVPSENGDDEDYAKFLANSLFMVDTSYCKMFEGVQEDSGSKFNLGEASLVGVLVEKLKALGIQDADIGVITPYSAQASVIRKTLREDSAELQRSFCEVSTVDGFQGREKEVIVISMVRSNLYGEVGFLKNERRMNVAVTRARKLCILIGDAQVTQTSMGSVKARVPEDQCSFYDNQISFLSNL